MPTACKLERIAHLKLLKELPRWKYFHLRLESAARRSTGHGYRWADSRQWPRARRFANGPCRAEICRPTMKRKLYWVISEVDHSSLLYQTVYKAGSSFSKDAAKVVQSAAGASFPRVQAWEDFVATKLCRSTLADLPCKKLTTQALHVAPSSFHNRIDPNKQKFLFNRDPAPACTDREADIQYQWDFQPAKIKLWPKKKKTVDFSVLTIQLPRLWSDRRPRLHTGCAAARKLVHPWPEPGLAIKTSCTIVENDLHNETAQVLRAKACRRRRRRTLEKDIHTWSGQRLVTPGS